MLTRLWEQNKRFLLKSGSAFAIFLVLNAILGAYVRRADGVLRKASALEREIRELKKELSHRYWQEKTRLEDYEAHENNLLADLQLPPEKELESFDAAAPVLQFNQAISRVWGEAVEKANRAGVALPEKLGPDDFRIESGDTREEYERYYDYLAVLRRALAALVDAGMNEIQRPNVIDVEDVPIRANDDVVCRLRAVSFTVSGTYASFLGVLRGVQAPKSFLQVRIAQLGPKRGDERLLTGTLEFAGLRLVQLTPAEIHGAKARYKGQARHRGGARPK